MTDTLPEAAQSEALAGQLEYALQAARRTARLSGGPGPVLALSALAYCNVSSIDPDVLRGDWGPDWRRFADVALISQGHDPVDPHGFVSAAPLPAVDAYVDLAARSVQPSWWSGRSLDDRLYLTARTQPSQLSDDDLVTLGWWDEIDRRRLARGLPYPTGKTSGSELFQILAAAISGDVTVLERLAELLPKHNAAVVEQLLAGAGARELPAELANDRGLWLLMLRLWAPGGSIRPAHSAFHRWAAFRRGYDLTLTRRFKAAWSQISAFAPHYTPATRLQKEVENLRAYLTLARSPDTAAMRQATTMLRGIRGSVVAKANREMIRRQSRLTTNERGPCENPYLVLGVDHGSSADVWKRAWRRARAEAYGDIDELSRVNKARDMIMALERDGVEGMGQIFIVPLEAKSLTPHAERPSERLVPGPAPYPNKTNHLLEVVAERLRSEAIRALAGAARPGADAGGG